MLFLIQLVHRKEYQPLLRSGLVCVLMCIVTTAFCFGRDGHSIAAMIAWEHLNPRAREGVTALLGSRTMADVSSDADDERTTETGSWHYVDFEINGGHELETEVPKTNILEAIERDRTIVANAQETSAARNQALRNLIHWLGDLHQPLHCSDNHDYGGNRTYVSYFGTTETKGRWKGRNQLHSVWDTQILRRYMDAKQTSNTEFAGTLSAQFSPMWDEITSGTPTAWALEGYRYSVQIVYGKLPPATGDPTKGGYYEIGETYNAVAEGLVQRQLAAAGLRLSSILNAIWP